MAISVALTVLGGIWGLVAALMARERKAKEDRLNSMEAAHKTHLEAVEKPQGRQSGQNWTSLGETWMASNWTSSPSRAGLEAQPSTAEMNASLAKLEGAFEKRLDKIDGHLKEVTAVLMGGLSKR